jgi:hypothetical protein
MKRCQIGVGGRHALDDAHDIMSECYGALGAMMSEIEELRIEIRGYVQDMARLGNALETMGSALTSYSKNLDKAASQYSDSLVYDKEYGDHE